MARISQTFHAGFGVLVDLDRDGANDSSGHSGGLIKVSQGNTLPYFTQPMVEAQAKQ
jgi:hypothetical protein